MLNNGATVGTLRQTTELERLHNALNDEAEMVCTQVQRLQVALGRLGAPHLPTDPKPGEEPKPSEETALGALNEKVRFLRHWRIELQYALERLEQVV